MRYYFIIGYIFILIYWIYISSKEKMKYKIVRQKRAKEKKCIRVTLYYIKRQRLSMTQIYRYEMVVTYYEANIEFELFKENEIVKDEELENFLKMFWIICLIILFHL